MNYNDAVLDYDAGEDDNKADGKSALQLLSISLSGCAKRLVLKG